MYAVSVSMFICLWQSKPLTLFTFRIICKALYILITKAILYDAQYFVNSAEFKKRKKSTVSR